MRNIQFLIIKGLSFSLAIWLGVFPIVEASISEIGSSTASSKSYKIPTESTSHSGRSAATSKTYASTTYVGFIDTAQGVNTASYKTNEVFVVDTPAVISPTPTSTTTVASTNASNNSRSSTGSSGGGSIKYDPQKVVQYVQKKQELLDSAKVKGSLGDLLVTNKILAQLRAYLPTSSSSQKQEPKSTKTDNTNVSFVSPSASEKSQKPTVSAGSNTEKSTANTDFKTVVRSEKETSSVGSSGDDQLNNTNTTRKERFTEKDLTKTNTAAGLNEDVEVFTEESLSEARTEQGTIELFNGLEQILFIEKNKESSRLEANPFTYSQKFISPKDLSTRTVNRNRIFYFLVYLAIFMLLNLLYLVYQRKKQKRDV